MPATAKRWQTRFETSNTYNYFSTPATICLYAETVNALQSEVRFHLLENKPLYISNRGDHIIGQMIYFYVDGHTRSPFFSEYDPRGLREGWWCKRERMADNRMVSSPEEFPLYLQSFENAIQHFTKYAIIPERCPTYQSKAIVGDDMRLSLLERILREGEEHPVNDLIQRGWHIVALEYKGELSMNGELMNRKAVFVMGHPESFTKAINSLFTVRYYRRWDGKLDLEDEMAFLIT
jgi:hypothetical protein